jgi:hypothetical protein
MPRYFFNIYGARAQLDQEGEELPDKTAACREALAFCGNMVRDINGDRLGPNAEWRMEVTDEFADPLLKIQINVTKIR